MPTAAASPPHPTRPPARQPLWRRGIGPRRQLPVASPVRPFAIVRAAAGAGRRNAIVGLEDHLRATYRADEATLCGSGTQALLLALRQARAHAGGKGSVALPAFACYDLATAAVGLGAPVDFFDLDPQTLAPDLESLRRALRAGATVVVVAPLYGIPVDWAPVAELCERAGAVLIEDAAQGQGAEWAGAPLGAHGGLSVLSFGRGKGWTGGGGGALLARGSMAGAGLSDALEASGRSADLRAVLGLAAQWAIGRPSVYGMATSMPGLRLGETVYHPPSEPVAMAPAAAAMALDHRAVSAERAADRRAMARLWDAGIETIAGLQPIRLPENAVGGYLRYPVLVPAREARPEVLEGAARLGIARSYPRPLPELAELRGLVGTARASWPGAERLVRTLMTLPTHWQVTASDRGRLLEFAETYFSESAV